MRLSDLLPDGLLSERQRAERDFERMDRDSVLEGLRHRLGELMDAERIFEGAQEFIESKNAELKKVQDALLFAKGEEVYRFQGRGLALWEFVEMPRRVHEELLRVQHQIREMEAGPDAAE